MEKQLKLNTFNSEFRKFCCISASLDGIAMESPHQILGLTENCFSESNATAKIKWNQILHFFTANRTLDEGQCHMLTCQNDMATMSYFYQAALVIMLVVTVCSNLLVILAIVKYPRLRNNVANLFILSLAFSDLLVGISVTPVKIRTSINNMHFCISENWCKFYITTDNMFFSISITTLLVISVDRYIALHYTYAYPRLMTQKRVKGIILLIWIYGILWGLISNIPWSKSDKDKPIAVNSNTCELQNSYYIYTVFVLVFFIPVLVMGVLYTRIFLVAKHHAQDIVTHCSMPANHNVSTQDSAALMTKNKKGVGFLKGLRSSLKLPSLKREHSGPYYRMIFRASKTVATVYGTFVVVWSPVCIISFIYNVCHDCFQGNQKPGENKKWYEIIFINFLPLVSSMANPFIYAILNKEYRKAFKNILLKTFPRQKFNQHNKKKKHNNSKNHSSNNNNSGSNNNNSNNNNSSNVGESVIWRNFRKLLAFLIKNIQKALWIDLYFLNNPYFKALQFDNHVNIMINCTFCDLKIITLRQITNYNE